MNRNLQQAAVLALALGLLSGCNSVNSSSSPSVGSSAVQYGDAKAVETVTNEFGSTDLQTIAESMTRSMLQSSVIARAPGTRPLLTVAEVKNKTSEYVDTRAITDTIRSQLLKSGSVRFAVDAAAMQNQTEELIRQNQTGLYNKNTVKKIGKMEGADYRMEGNIVSIVKKTADLQDVWYKFNLQLIHIESGTIEWSDEKEIRKTSKR
ncbi:MAG: penicillin-binding protein activator LpoB [Magnetococcales bacterium]|nr:penicillin-binding protein activator LpoB [Magnetococcales bacterium]